MGGFVSQLSPDDFDNLWPTEWVREELRSCNRAYLAHATNALLRGRESWPNQQSERFAEELSEALDLGVLPVSPTDPAFREIMEKGERFNWAVLLDGTLRISPSMVNSEVGLRRISHAILCYNGGDVLAAGEGCADDYLSNTTGHYKNEEFVLVPVRQAFIKIGMTFNR